MKDVPTEENIAYSCHSNNLIPSDINSTTQILFKKNLSYVSHSVEQTNNDSPAQNNEYEAVDATPYKQWVIGKNPIFYTYYLCFITCGETHQNNNPVYEEINNWC